MDITEHDLPWNKSERPQGYVPLRAELFEDQDIAFREYIRAHALNKTNVIRRLVDKLLLGEVDLKIKQRIRRSKGNKF